MLIILVSVSDFQEMFLNILALEAPLIFVAWKILKEF